MEMEHAALIFVIQDHLDDLCTLSQVLQAGGYRVLIASDGESAFEKLANVVPDLILVDRAIAASPGVEICQMLTRNVNTLDIPVLLLMAPDDVNEQGLPAEVVDVITKPYHPNTVLNRIKLHLQLRSLNLTLQAQHQQLSQEITARRLIEADLQKLNNNLETHIHERTETLHQALHRLKEQDEELRYKAYHDDLTGLHNRNGLIQYLDQCLAHQQPKTVFFLDLDRFKRINDRFGYGVGDILLQGVAERLQSFIGTNAIVGRLGGDEFLVVTDVQPHHGKAIAQQLIEHLRFPFQLMQGSLQIGTCIGIIPDTLSYRNATEILRDADIALHQAKRIGTNIIMPLTPQMQEAAMARITLEDDIRAGIEQDQFMLHYQPLISLKSRQIIGFEALIRWNHPTRGFIPPSQFIPLAEETGLIQALDFWVLKAVARQWHAWQYQGIDLNTITINVNLATIHFQQRDFLRQLDTLLSHINVPPRALKLEITESLFLDSSSLTLYALEHLTRKGYFLCIDDFGTGYSSLSRLHTFPIQGLKIDRSFVSAMSEDSSAIVQTIIALAHHLNLNVVAEGIETAEQGDQLQRLGCDVGQGFWFARPLPPAIATQHLSTNDPLRMCS
ncbi:putative bifunctional diguanylate cyclase/phosphodiesterase [Spirulina major]|uniref:putative bifunctional diguanylate cyclase/phosphodiesterase n=1 Tax=Spirulina major TaxID=270636 RepID=UPI0009339D7B|nr:EAL domain-containing protein [Spirulina major]